MLNIAIFGAGRIAKIHAKNIANHAQCTIRYVIDPVKNAAEELAACYGAKVVSTEHALSDPDVHAVLIASSTDTHADYIEAAARAKKAIFCEKPIDLSLDRVHQCLNTVKEHNVTLLVGFNRRFDPQMSTLKQQYKEGKIGKAETLLIISRDPSAPPAEYVSRSGGLFRDMMIHDLDMARFILEEDPIKIQANGSCLVNPEIGKQGDIDTASVTLFFPSGKQAVILNSRRSGYGYDQRIELHGEKGLLRVNNLLENYVEHIGNEQTEGARPLDFFLQRYADAYRIEWDHFVDVLVNKAPLLASGLDGEKALQLADAAVKSLKSEKIVSL